MAEQTLSTQQFVEIQEIKDGIVYLKGGGIRRILAVGGVNFDLKSEEEQASILRSFQDFLNTIDFSVQIFIHSRKVNVDSYLQKLLGRRAEEPNELLKIQIEDYVEFVRSFVQDNPIITKSFFVVVPYDTPAISSPKRGLMNLFKGSRAPREAETDKRVEREKQLFQLGQRVDEVTMGLESIGVHVEPLEDEEVTELFYNLYNPELVEKKGLAIAETEEQRGHKDV